MPPVDFGARLKEHRVARGWTQDDLARATDGAVTGAFLSMLETGKRGASHDVVEALADALSLPAADRSELHRLRARGRPLPIERRVLLLEQHLSDLEARVDQLEQPAAPVMQMRPAAKRRPREDR